MKKYLILVLSLCISCVNKKEDKKSTDIKTISTTITNETSLNNRVNKTKEPQNDPSELISNLNKFRNAVCKPDKQSVKKYIEFPILDSSSEGRVSISYEEKDYIEKYNQIFSEEFVKSIQNIDFEKLVKNKKNETIKINGQEGRYYVCKASINEEYNYIEFYIATYKKTESENNEEMFFCSATYRFDIKNNNITLTHIEYVG